MESRLSSLWEITVSVNFSGTCEEVTQKAKGILGDNIKYIRSNFSKVVIDETRTSWLTGSIVVNTSEYSEQEVVRFFEAIVAKGWSMVPYIPSKGEPEKNLYEPPQYGFGALDPKELI